MVEKINPTYKALILDMDGVLWRGSQPIGDLPLIFKSISDKGLRIVFATNNATRTTAEVQTKLERYGVLVREEQIVTSPIAVAFVLRQRFPAGSKIFVVGEKGLLDPIVEAGFQVGVENACAVVAGLDRTITYDKLKTATILIRSGLPFIGTNPDLTFPSPEGLVPGAGSILAAIQAATGIEPEIIGKPNSTLFEVALQRLGTQSDETLVVGDRLDTDILGGQRGGFSTALVLSGVSTPEDYARWNPKPDMVANTLADLIAKL